MGRAVQKRLVRKLDLERAISKIAPHPAPKAHLEQYTITPEVAAELLYIAAYTNNDIVDKTIVDLGCGTGRLAIGSILLGAKGAVGVDLDKTAVRTACSTAEKMGLKQKTQWIIADIATITGTFDTVLQNPPFGVQRRKADRCFVEKALEVGNRIYSIHASSRGKPSPSQTRRECGHKRVPVSPFAFLQTLVTKNHGKILAVYTMPMEIPHMFDFHTKVKHRFPVDLYVMESGKTAYHHTRRRSIKRFIEEHDGELANDSASDTQT